MSRLQVDTDKITQQFCSVTGISESEVREVSHSFPVDLRGHILLDHREFQFTLTPTGVKIQKGTIKESGCDD